mmetsp:Transcript_24647/g.79668  ORF Transcript_24647/g.79668 Transcript_24647/m.79668 type:complete len:353 (+) Transcript_24647:166-1224(+)
MAGPSVPLFFLDAREAIVLLWRMRCFERYDGMRGSPRRTRRKEEQRAQEGEEESRGDERFFFFLGRVGEEPVDGGTQVAVGGRQSSLVGIAVVEAHGFEVLEVAVEVRLGRRRRRSDVGPGVRRDGVRLLRGRRRPRGLLLLLEAGRGEHVGEIREAASAAEESLEEGGVRRGGHRRKGASTPPGRRRVRGRRRRRPGIREGPGGGVGRRLPLLLLRRRGGGPPKEVRLGVGEGFLNLLVHPSQSVHAFGVVLELGHGEVLMSHGFPEARGGPGDFHGLPQHVRVREGVPQLRIRVEDRPESRVRFYEGPKRLGRVHQVPRQRRIQRRLHRRRITHQTPPQRLRVDAAAAAP